MLRASENAIEIRVYYEDTDFSGCVYHATYLRFLERARTEWLRRLGWDHRELAKTSGVVFAVRSLAIEYLAPALMDDVLRVTARATKLRGASLEFQQQISRDDQTLIDATVLIASLRDGRPTRIPDFIRRSVGRQTEAL